LKRFTVLPIANRLHTGTRIRERRLDLGLRQAELAKRLGISASYLNLIEHNHRRIAGPLLVAMGKALDVDPTLLTQGAARATLDQMHAAASSADTPPEVARTEELAARYPGWADVIAGQQSRIAALEARIQELTDRMTSDPELATSLHAVISAVTSIRSTAAILTSDESLDADWLRRFHRNIHDDAIRLAGSSDALVRYLDAPADSDVPLSPFDEVRSALDQSGFHIPSLEKPRGDPAAAAANAGLSPAATLLLETYLARYHQVAQILPLANFTPVIMRVGAAPDVLADHFNVPLVDVLIRCATLPDIAGVPAMGLAMCDGSGAITFEKQIPGFALPPSGRACPLWPLFTAIGQPDRPIKTAVGLPGQQQDRFACYAIATQRTGSLTRPPSVSATMLVIPAPEIEPANVLPVGPTCRICPRKGCDARREPTALGSAL
jgi:predicted transcriptional regulator/DNA-binding XRE family transcriptional regulator